jgi:hypothetical protein
MTRKMIAAPAMCSPGIAPGQSEAAGPVASPEGVAARYSTPSIQTDLGRG